MNIKTDDGNGNETDEIIDTKNSSFVYYYYIGTVSVKYCFYNGYTYGQYSAAAAQTARALEVADGSITEAKLAANSVTTAKLASNTLSAMFAKIGTFSSGEAGEDRVVISDSLIQIIDANNNVRLRLGKW